MTLQPSSEGSLYRANLSVNRMTQALNLSPRKINDKSFLHLQPPPTNGGSEDVDGNIVTRKTFTHPRRQRL